MPYQPLVNKLNSDCQSALDGKKLFDQVSAAMQSPLEERDNALKNVIMKNFPDDCAEYQDLRARYSIHYRILSVDMSLEDQRNKEKMYNIPKYFSQYLGIVKEMVKDIDPNHEVKPFFGLSEKESVDMQMKAADSFTRKEAVRYELFEVRKDFNHCYEDIELAKVVDKTTNQLHKYSTADDRVKSGIESIYMTKKIIEEELKSRGLIWRILNWFGEAKEMRNVIKAIDKALKDVEFPRDRKTKDDVKALYDKPDIYGAEKETILDVAQKNYAAAAAEKDEITKMFHVRFRPPTSTAEIEKQFEVVGKITKELNHNDAISTAAKKVFNANVEKLIAMKHYNDKYVDKKYKPDNDKKDLTEAELAEEAESAFEKMNKQFNKVETNLLADYPKYVSITRQDIDKAMNVRESLASTVFNDLNNNVKNVESEVPVHTAPTQTIDHSINK